MYKPGWGKLGNLYMVLKTGLKVMISALCGALVTGCAFHGDETVARDDHASPFPMISGRVPCMASSVACTAEEFALLSAPEKVIYTTRATVVPLDQSVQDNPETPEQRESARNAADDESKDSKGE